MLRHGNIIGKVLLILLGVWLLIVLDAPVLIWQGPHANYLIETSLVAYALGMASAAVSGILFRISLRNIPTVRSGPTISESKFGSFDEREPVPDDYDPDYNRLEKEWMRRRAVGEIGEAGS